MASYPILVIMSILAKHPGCNASPDDPHTLFIRTSPIIYRRGPQQASFLFQLVSTRPVSTTDQSWTASGEPFVHQGNQAFRLAVPPRALHNRSYLPGVKRYTERVSVVITSARCGVSFIVDLVEERISQKTLIACHCVDSGFVTMPFRRGGGSAIP